MEQQPLWFEDLYDALRDVVRACGGPKAIGHALFPHKTPAKAGEHLLNCLSRDRAEKLDPDCVTPLSVYLVSESCELTHEIFDVGGGRYARIFIGMNEGWIKGPGEPATRFPLRDNPRRAAGRSFEEHS